MNLEKVTRRYVFAYTVASVLYTSYLDNKYRQLAIEHEKVLKKLLEAQGYALSQGVTAVAATAVLKKTVSGHYSNPDEMMQDYNFEKIAALYEVQEHLEKS